MADYRPAAAGRGVPATPRRHSVSCGTPFDSLRRAKRRSGRGWPCVVFIYWFSAPHNALSGGTRIPGTVRGYGRPAPELQKLFLRGHGGSSAALVVQQEDAIRNAAGPFDTGVREYSEKELACSGSEATEGKSELSALIICFAALLMAGVRLICLAGRRRSEPLSQGAHPLQDAPPPHHQGSSRPPPVPKRMGSGPERIFTRPRAPNSGRSASDA